MVQDDGESVVTTDVTGLFVVTGPGGAVGPRVGPGLSVVSGSGETDTQVLSSSFMAFNKGYLRKNIILFMERLRVLSFSDLSVGRIL